MVLSFIGLCRPFILIGMVWKEEDIGREAADGNAHTGGKREIQIIKINNTERKGNKDGIEGNFLREEEEALEDNFVEIEDN